MTVQTENTKSPILHETDAPNGDFQSLKEDIVISGISGRLPKSSSIEEFKKNLLQGENCIMDVNDRWPPGIYGLPKRIGVLNDLCSFDATYFGVNDHLANEMNPQLRMILEVTYEAMVDAGFNPASLRGTKTGVFIGVSASESLHMCANDVESSDGSAVIGGYKVMCANEISYSFDFKGPSYTVDAACSAAFHAFHQAVTAMKNGECDAAIVGGVNLILKITNSVLFHQLNMTSQDCTSKVFDARANGYVRSDTVAAIFLQKSTDARRVYATVVKTKTNADGYKVEGITYPSKEMQSKLIRDIYDEAGINPADIAYVEAHGTGTKIGDPEEANTITDIFCKDRKGPLLIGSVKSNIGHSESASGLSALIKVLIAMENGIIPPNLHYKVPNPNILGLLDGRLKVIDKLTPFDGSFVGINNFGFGGANAHVILRRNPKLKLSPELGTKLAKLIAISGRTIEAVNYMLDEARKHEQDDEFIALLRDIHADDIPGHPVRGFEILGSPDSRQVDNYSGFKKPVWFICSGMGSQWEGMGRNLMYIDTFRRSLERCAAVLKKVGIDLMDLILHGTHETYQNILNNFVTIAAIQIALVDLLTLLGIHADGVVGHSIGELACAYVDGSLTAEQMILVAYWRGKLIQDTNLTVGAMAAIGLSWKEAAKRCPPDVYRACHNSADSVTVSGPIAAIHKFIKELQDEKIFAKVVNSSGYAFHSKYIASTESKLLGALEKIIPYPKKRSSKWISSSVPESDWGNPLVQFSSASYHVNNLLSPVLFHEATAHIPKNAIVIEVGPHCLLQPILRTSLPSSVTNIGLQKSDHKNNLVHFLSGIGKLYSAGAQPKISKLYPPVSYPVGRGTPMINSLIKWDHSTKWRTPDFSYLIHNTETTIIVDVSKETDAFLIGHRIDGRTLYPAFGYVNLVWNTFTKLNNLDPKKAPIVFENLQFHRPTIIPKQGSVKFTINIFNGSGNFEIREGESVTVTGAIRMAKDIAKEQLDLPALSTGIERGLIELSKKDIYRELKLRGYDYTGVFKSIKSADNRGITGELEWHDNWISFMDSLLQFVILQDNSRSLFVPTRIRYLSIDPIYHMKLVNELPQDGKTIPVYNYRNINCVKSGGVEMRDVKPSLIQRKPQKSPRYERYTFVPYENSEMLGENCDKIKENSLSVLLQIMCENMHIAKMKIAEVTGERPMEALLTSHVLNILQNEPMIRIIESLLITTSPENYKNYINPLDQSTVDVAASDVTKASTNKDLHLLLAADVLTNKSLNVLKNLSASLTSNGYVILEESGEYDKNILNATGLTLVAIQTNFERKYLLLKKTEQKHQPTIIYATEKNFSWLEDVKVALERAETKEILVVSEGEELFGIVGFMNCLRYESGATITRYIFVQDQNAPKFSLTEPFYEQQLSKQVMANVLKGGQWGCFRHLCLERNNETPSFQTEHAFANTLIRGDLSSFSWIQSPLDYYEPEKYSGKEMCSVYYASLNFKDIMFATGKLSADALVHNMATQDCVLGFEFSGRDTKGRRVMGMLDARGLATNVLVDPLLMWEVPDKWTLEEAATVPVAYATSYYALIMRGQLEPGESILIHAGSGGVGQASIAIALHMGCKVFTTVGSQEKRNFLKKVFPQLTDRNIGNSRDISFEQLIMNETHGRGVDVILNSLAEQKLRATLRCLATGGRFLEIGKYDIIKDTRLNIFDYSNASFHGINLDLFSDTDNINRRILVQLLNEGIKNGIVQPLPTTIFPIDQVEKAFRYMATGKHIGKVLLQIREEEAEKVVSSPSRKIVESVPRIYMNPKKSYLLVGGLGGFGLELANWMIGRGAKDIVLSSRTGIRTGYQSLCVRRWRESGVNVVISAVNCTTLAGAEQLIKNSNKIAPIGGIFNLAAVLSDGLIENLNEDNFKTVILPKIDATKNLDYVSRKYCPSLDYFVVFSSVACGKGNIGQTNYGFANSAMERIVEKRKSDGLPGLAIQWGPVGDVGLFIENIGDVEMDIHVAIPQRMDSCLSSMDVLVQELHPIVSSVIYEGKNKSNENLDDLNLVDVIANILGIRDVKQVNSNSTLGDLGMDSLMSAEIKQILERNYDLVLSPQEIRNLNFGSLLKLSPSNTKTNEPSTATSQSNIESMPNELLFPFDNGEILPIQSLVKLETKSSKGAALFLVHAIEGVVSIFTTLASELERPAWGVQCTAETPLDSITVIANAYVNQIREIQKNGPYYIAGYSFGASVAFEMGLLLEKAGEEVILTLIDGSPTFLRFHILRFMSIFGMEENSNDTVKRSLAFLANNFTSNISFDQAYDILKSEPSEEQALMRMIESMDNVQFKPEDLKIAASLFLKKVRAASAYIPCEKFNGKVTLIKAESTVPIPDNNFGLIEMCKQNVQIIELAGNHRSILLGDSAKRMASILNL